MASRLALVAFLLMVSVAAAGARWALGGDDADNGAGVAAGTSVLIGQPAQGGSAGSQHILWNGAVWLFGLGLVVTLGRGHARQPAAE